MYPSTVFTVLILAASFKLGGTQTIDPSTVDQTTRTKWCDNQKSACPLLCLQIPGASDATEDNRCDDKTLVFSCICDNGQSPNASEYSQTIPYFECTEFGNQCVKACNGDSACQSACRSDHPCGAQSPTRVNTSTITSSTHTPTSTNKPSATTTTTGGSAVYTGFGGGSTSSPSSGKKNTSSAQALAIGFGRTYGLALVLAAVCGGVVILL